MEKHPDYQLDPDTPPLAEHRGSVDRHGEHEGKLEARRGSKLTEARDLYGDVATAEEYGYVSRG